MDIPSFSLCLSATPLGKPTVFGKHPCDGNTDCGRGLVEDRLTLLRHTRKDVPYHTWDGQYVLCNTWNGEYVLIHISNGEYVLFHMSNGELIKGVLK